MAETNEESLRILERVEKELKPLYVALEGAALDDPRWKRLQVLGAAYTIQWGQIAKAQGLFE